MFCVLSILVQIKSVSQSAIRGTFNATKLFNVLYSVTDILAYMTELDPSAAESSRRRQPKTGCAAAAEKKFGAPPSQPKLSAAAAAVIFSAGRGWRKNSREWVCDIIVDVANFITDSASERILKIGQYLTKLRTRVGLYCVLFSRLLIKHGSAALCN